MPSIAAQVAMKSVWQMSSLLCEAACTLPGFGSRKELRHDPAGDIGEAVVAALEAVGEPCVIEAE